MLDQRQEAGVFGIGTSGRRDFSRHLFVSESSNGCGSKIGTKNGTLVNGKAKTCVSFSSFSGGCNFDPYPNIERKLPGFKAEG